MDDDIRDVYEQLGDVDFQIGELVSNTSKEAMLTRMTLVKRKKVLLEKMNELLKSE